MRIVALLLVTGSLALTAGAAQAEDTPVADVVEGVKESGRAVGHAVRDTGKKVGHGVRDVTREAGHAIRDTTKDIGHATRDAVREIKQGNADTPAKDGE